MKLSFGAVFLLISLNSYGNNMEQGKIDTQKLFDSVLPLAQQFLLENDEFFPFGEVMKPNGEQVSLSAQLEDERPSSSDLIELLKNHYIQSAQAQDIIASSLAYDVKIEGSDAIAVDLDHVSGYSVSVFVPYELTDNELVIGEMFTLKGKNQIFK